MNKKLLTVAVAAGVAATSLAAIADVKVYGRVEVEFVSAENNTGLDQTEVVDTGMGRWGIKATEKLGGGMTGIAVLEFNNNAATSVEGSRQQFVGLKGKFGTFAMGTFNGVYKTTGGAGLDPLNATFMEARNNGGQAAGGMANSGYLSNSMMWVSPSVNGITAKALMRDENASGAGNDWQVAVEYKNGPMMGFIAHSENVGGNSADDTSLTKVGGRMSMAQHTFYFQYEDDDGGLNTPADKTTLTGTGITDPGAQDGEVYFVGYKMKLGKNAIIAQFGESDYDTREGSGSYMALAGVHSFSKTTRVYAGWRQTDDDSVAATNEIDIFGFGIRKDF
jgi:predicted porin